MGCCVTAAETQLSHVGAGWLIVRSAKVDAVLENQP